MKLGKLVLAISWITIIGLGSCAKKSSPITNLQLEKLDSIALKDVPKGAPGVAAGIVINGEIAYEKYGGYANLEDSLRIDENARFNIASNGKQFTALAILDLVAQKKMNLDDDIRTFFPTLFPTIKSEIKVSHLLNHTSGIRDVYDLWSLQGITWWEHTYTMEDALDLLEKQSDLNFEPGKEYSYSNSNYMLLAEIVGIVSKSNFVDFTKQMFLDLNMPNTSFVNDHKSIDGFIARPYFNFDTWYGYDWIWNIHGDGNIFSTLKDQLEFEKILQTKKNKRFSKELLERSQSLISGSSNEKYGYGVEFMEHRTIPYKYHGGSTGAWKAITARFEEQGISIVTLTNSGKTDPMSQTLASADVLLDLESNAKEIRLTPESIGPEVSIADVVGLYEINGYIWQFVDRNGELYLLRSGRNDTKLIREADNVFQQWNDAPFKQEFTKNENGEMEVTAYYTNTEPFTLTRMNTDFSNFDFESVQGSFLNRETDVSFSISHQSNLNYEVTSDTTIMNAILLSSDEMVINDYDYRLRFEKDNEGAVSAIFLTSGRIQNVQFSRVK